MKKHLSIALSFALFISSGVMANANNFSDTKNHWAKDSIEKVVTLGYMKGLGNNRFGTGKNISREELAAIVVRLAGDPSASTTLKFSDTSGRWSEQVILKSVASDLMLPIHSDNFAPVQNATREEVARAIQRTLRYKGVQLQTTPQNFSDIANSSYQSEIQYVASLSIMSGYPDGTFAPRKSVTRAELASIIVRTNEVINGGILPQTQSASQNVEKKTQLTTKNEQKNKNAKQKQSSDIINVTVQTIQGTTTVSGKYNWEYAQKVLDLVNAERTKAGVSPLTSADDLDSGTALRAAELTVFWDHTRPNGKPFHTVGTDCWAENIAAGQQTPEEVVNSWMNSPNHRKNILNKEFKRMSVSLFIPNHSSQYTAYWVQHFA